MSYDGICGAEFLEKLSPALAILAQDVRAGGRECRGLDIRALSTGAIHCDDRVRRPRVGSRGGRLVSLIFLRPWS